MTGAADARFMRLALTLAARGLGCVWSNPAVGCVIVAGGRIVGRGFTAPGGRPHAETQALVQAGAAARGATAYVSLEPCAHHGRTPPCAEALIAAGVGRVVSAHEDPDPRVAGRGHAMLRTVETGVLEREARALQAGFLSRVTRGRPMLALKLAASLDGRIATATGESRWITGPQARRMVHALRATHDAVLVGAGTARADDPMLTVRDLGAAHQPLRVVCDSRLSLPVDSALGRSAREVPVWLCHGPEAPQAARAAWETAGARLVPCVLDAAGRVDAADMLARLGAAGLTRVFCEGGGQLAASLLSAGLVDGLHLFSAGLALGAGGQPALGDLPGLNLSAAPRFRLDAARAVGGDLYQHWLAGA